MVTVIIPALNEQGTIAEVVKFCFTKPLVNEVIVVDDQSADNTRELAEANGAKVLVSKVRGKGISMKEGILSASNQLLVFLDADIHPYYHLDSKCIHSLCKTNALMHIAHKYDISLENCIAIGDSINDLCMIEKAGMGIAFCSKNNRLINVADKTIDISSFAGLLDVESLYKKKKAELN